MKQVSIYSLKVWLSAALLAPLVYIVLYSIYPLFNHGISFPQYGLLLNKYFEGVLLFVRFNCPSWVLMTLVLIFVPSLKKPSIENRLFIFICVEIVFFLMYHFVTNPPVLFMRSDLIMQQASAIATFIFIFFYKVKGAVATQKATAKKATTKKKIA
jgi:hypothetical protein